MSTSRLRLILTALALVLAVIQGAAALGQTPAARPHGPVTASASQPSGDVRLAAIRPEQRASVDADAPRDLPLYEIAATIEPPASATADPRIQGRLDLAYINATGEPLSELPFRLYANGPDAERDAITVGDVLVDGQETEAALSVDNSVLAVPLGEPLAAGAAVEIGMTFTAVLPADSRDHYGIFGADSETGALALAHWYPIVAGRDPARGWVLDPPSENGDPIFSGTALYDVSLTMPDAWRAVTTGVETGETATPEAGTTTRRYLSGPARDFTIVADADLDVITGTVNGITVNSWFQPGQDRIGEAVLTYAIQAVTVLEPLLGPYPYEELDFVGVELSGAAGVEFPQLIYIGAGYYTDALSQRIPNSLDFTIAHEVIHQWFYNLVGNNQYDDAFIDEGLTNYLTAGVYVRQQYGDAAAQQAIDRYLQGPFENAVRSGDDPVVDQATDDFPSGRDYVLAAYSKAPLGFEAIHERIGDDAFFTALARYVADFRFEVATPTDLKAAFEEASGQDLDALWTHWFERAEGEQDVGS